MIFWLFTAITFGLDRLTKHLVTSSLKIGDSLPVIENFFHLTLIENPGAAFGMLANKRWFFVLVTLLILGIVLYLITTTAARRDAWLMTALGLVSGGALGNLVDRIQSGLVIDFLDFRGIWSYIFNVADMGVVIGVFLLAWRIIAGEDLWK